MLDTPVVFLIFRRPDLTAQVFEAIRQAKPKKLLVVADGPRNEDEATLCQQARAVTEQIDWDCEVLRNYSDVNLGCRQRVSSGLDWAFDEVEEAIVLEDDCLPHPDFFRYCEHLLKRYRWDERIWSICGSNFQLGHRRGEASYYFSIHGDSWGWATWKRAWKHYAEAETQWFSFRDSGRLADIFPIPREQIYWREILDCLFIEGKPNTWDYQWWLASWMNNGLHAWPNVCLVSNVGFGGDGTHTFGDSAFASLNLEAMGEIVHPQFILPSRDADEFAFLHRRNGLQQIEDERYQIERQRYGWTHPWVLRMRDLRREGAIHYVRSRLHRCIPFFRENATGSWP